MKVLIPVCSPPVSNKSMYRPCSLQHLTNVLIFLLNLGMLLLLKNILVGRTDIVIEQIYLVLHQNMLDEELSIPVILML